MRTRERRSNGFLLALAVIGSTVCAMAQALAQGSGAAPAKMGPTGWVPKSIAYIKASNTTTDNRFGFWVTVSSDGNTMAVGTPFENGGSKGINGNQADHSMVSAGAVYVYTRKPGAAWAPQAYIKASNPHEGAQFGNAVALSGDGNTLAVGSYVEDSSATGINGNQTDHSMDSAGAVYVFTRNGATWSQQAYVKASNTGGSDQFGFSVALSANGNTLAASAIEEASKATGVNGDQTDDSAGGRGAVYMFTRSGTTWSQQAYVKPEATGALFGYQVALSADGNTLAAGASDEDPGTVYVFTRTGTAWSQQGHLNGINGEAGDSMGWSVAISADGNTIATGADDEDSLLTGVPPATAGANDRARDTSAGAAYIFVRTGTTWAQQVWLKAINTRKNDQYGVSITISGDGNTVAVGSHFGAGTGASKGVNGDPSSDDLPGSGSVYVYTRSGTTWTPAAYVKAPNATENAEFGVSVAMNSDGKTLAVGAIKEGSGAKGVNGNQADKSAVDSGAVYVLSY
jgi:trimeric autotransporter adhesin